MRDLNKELREARLDVKASQMEADEGAERCRRATQEVNAAITESQRADESYVHALNMLSWSKQRLKKLEGEANDN